MISSFSRTVPVLFGPGSSLRTGLKAKEFGANKMLCLHGSGMKKSGIADKIINNLKSAGIEVVVYDGIKEDTPDSTVNEAAELANKEQVDGVVGVGGGSCMDTAKAVNVLTTNPPPVSQYYVGGGAEQKPGKVLILIPTTAGTGSEVTSVSVVSDSATSSKKGIMGPGATANQAIVDPELLLGLSPNMTAATGMDAFAHAVEALTSEGMNPMSDLLAEKAVSLISNNLVKAVKDGSNLEFRKNMAFASLIAGIAFDDSLVHWGHAMAHTMGARFHIPHGIACAIALPAAVEFLADAVPEKLRIAASAMELSLPEDMPPLDVGAAVAEEIRRLNREIGIPGLKEYDIKKESLEQIVPGVLEDDTSMFGPKLASHDEVLSMLKRAYEY